MTAIEPSFGATALPVAAVSRDLSEAELIALVHDLAARPEHWAHLIDHDPERRRYEVLLRDDHVAVWLICWMGELRRHSVSYAEELRPLDAAA